MQAANEALFDHILKVYLGTTGVNRKDIVFVPVTINYDRVIEADSFPLELLGESVRRESPFKIMKQLMFAKKQLGKVIVRYGEPQSLQDHLNRHLQTNKLKPVALSDKVEFTKFAKKLSE